MKTNHYKFSPAQVKFSNSSYSSSDWQQQVSYYQQKLSQDPAKTWVLYHADSYRFSVLLFALLTAGKDIVLPSNAQPAQIEYVKRFAQASIGSADIQADIQFNVDSDVTLGGAKPTLLDEKTWQLPSQAKLHFFTSGSTGQPKCITKAFSQLMTEVIALEREFSALVAQSTFVSTVSHQHIYGMLFKLLWPVLMGRNVICQAFEYPEHISQAVQTLNLTNVVLIASPAHLHRIYLDNVLLDIAESLSLIFSSGGPLDGDKNCALQQQLHTPIIEVFGSTETGGIAWRKKQTETDELWTVFSGIKISLAENNNLLQIVSPYLASNDIYLTDDRVEIVNSTQFKLLGRADRIVKIEEKRVSLDEVQQKLIQHEYVQDAYVLVVETSRKQLACVLELTEAGQAQLSGVKKFQQDRFFRQYLASWFEAVVIPKKFRYTAALPYNAQGKLIKQDVELLFV